MESPLSPYRVLDLADEKGMFCGKILADLGANVIKVERPGGDASRNIGPFYQDKPHPEKSLFWFANNTGKRGITLNIETKDGQELFKRLAKTADIVIESFQPGYLDGLQLGYRALNLLNPQIIMASITPFGQTGPYKDYKSSDIVATAMSGLMFVCGDDDRSPLRCSVEQALPMAGLNAAAGTLLALYSRHITGEGQHVDVSMQENIIMATIVPFWDMTEMIWGRGGAFITRDKFKRRNIFTCKDGRVSWHILSGPFGGKTNAVVKWMAQEGKAGDLEGINWETIDMDKVNQEQIDAWERLFEVFFMSHTKSELQKGSLDRDIMLFPVSNIGDLAENEQLTFRKFWVKVEHAKLGAKLSYPGAPFKSTGDMWHITRRPPLIGEHNEDIYHHELGLSKEELAVLKQAGVI